jgi:hypothetical protein
MATDVGLADGQFATAAYFNDRIPFIAGANKSKVKLIYFHARYTGSVWEVVSTTDSAGIVSGNLAWSTDHLNITPSGYTAIVPAFTTPVYNAAVALIPQVTPASTTQIQVHFIDYAGVRVTTQATTMNFTMLALGI